jgi:hypothetical protein
MFNLIRIAAPLIAVALVAWFVYEVFVTGDGVAALPAAPVAGSSRSA